MGAEEQVRKASEQFYTALNRMLNGDVDPLLNIWSHGDGVTVMNPTGDLQTSWTNVRQTFENVSKMATNGKVKLNNQAINVVGDLAYELGIERGQTMFSGKPYTIELRVTNIYRREGDDWKLVHHHTDISPDMVDLIKKAQLEPK